MSVLINSVFFYILIITSKAQNDCTEDPSSITPECIQDFTTDLWSPKQRVANLKLTTQKINRLMDGPRSSFRSAQVVQNSTDQILDKFDLMIANESQYKDFELIVFSNLIVQMFKVKTTNVSGIVVYQNENEFKHERIYRNSTLQGVLGGGDVLVAAYLPRALLKQLEAQLEDPVVAITIFFKDSLFAEAQALHKTSGIAFGILIPGFKGEFEAPIKLAYKVDPEDVGLKECAHWLYGPHRHGAWTQDQRTSTCGKLEICEYYHVTHFGMLVLNDADSLKTHKTALDVITLVGCCLSLVGIFGVLLTAVLFKKWRENKGNIILSNHALAALLQIVILYASELVKEVAVCDNNWCFWTGILLHYIVLAQFFWILVISYLQYKRYVQIFGSPTTHLVLKSCLIGWGGPLPIVIILGVFFNQSYVKSSASLCYPSGLALYLGVLFPILLIVLINIGIFGLILTSIYWNRDVPRLSDNVKILRARLVFLLFFQMGLTWMFGFMSNLGITFVYLFCLTAPLQGFIVFLLFIVFNENTAQMYKKLFGLYKKPTRAPDSSASTRLS